MSESLTGVLSYQMGGMTFSRYGKDFKPETLLVKGIVEITNDWSITAFRIILSTVTAVSLYLFKPKRICSRDPSFKVLPFNL